jgi:protease I
MASRQGRQRRPSYSPPRQARFEAFNHVDKADTFEVHPAICDVGPLDYSALVLARAAWSTPTSSAPSRRRCSFVNLVFESGKPVAVICDEAWVMVEADRVRGRTLTSWPSLKTDIRNAAGNWVDAEVRSAPTGRTPW